ncbi:MAG: bifunctional diaminohydroxyphosphoribosylaminopyrimidine deaminase/5-amino-6-(5-phosphoribosylamino)uracil reductase RibD [Candidatus Dormibacteria bacterium]
MTETASTFMTTALELAARAGASCSPNPMVGAVVVQRGEVVGHGFHRERGGPHAEVEALAEAGERARGADLYVTLEPCNHRGRTGPCTETIVRAGVARVHVALRDPNPAVQGGGVEALREAGVTVHLGDGEAAARRLVRPWLRWVTSGLPHVTAKFAESLDGRVATHSGESQWITSEPARALGHTLRATSDAVMAGVGTVLADDPRLTARPAGDGATRQPLRVVVDSRLRTPATSRVFETPGVLVATTSAAPVAARRQLESRGAVVEVFDGDRGRVHLAGLLQALGAREVTSLLVEGGPALLGSMFDQDLVDEVVAFIAPVVIGGAGAPGAVGGAGPASLAAAHPLHELEWTSVGPDLMIRGVVAGRSQVVVPQAAAARAH